ncbi:hypothetical protein [Synechococcus sp. UW140]|uniref:hypothetical protein n=1 Tax=Synechococcus sp. UW140 TaxID=368503 RepID=UPI001A7E0998|nr:hypothetical protein [Synechococcus sp. UW140]
MVQLHDLMAVRETHRSDQTQWSKDQPAQSQFLLLLLVPGNFASMSLLISITTASQRADVSISRASGIDNLIAYAPLDPCLPSLCPTPVR